MIVPAQSIDDQISGPIGVYEAQQVQMSVPDLDMSAR